MKAITFLVFVLISTLLTFLIASVAIEKFTDADLKDHRTDNLKFDMNIEPAEINLKNTPTDTDFKSNIDENKSLSEDKVLSSIDQISTEKISPTIVIEITPTKTPTKKPTPIPTLTPTISVEIPDFTSEQIYNLINNYSAKFGVDPNVIRHVALCESGFNPKAKNWIYAGLFQFSPTTWETWRRKMNQDSNTDLRYHAEEAIETASYAISLNKGSMWPNCMP